MHYSGRNDNAVLSLRFLTLSRKGGLSQVCTNGVDFPCRVWACLIRTVPVNTSPEAKTAEAYICRGLLHTARVLDIKVSNLLLLAAYERKNKTVWVFTSSLQEMIQVVMMWWHWTRLYFSFWRCAHTGVWCGFRNGNDKTMWEKSMGVLFLKCCLTAFSGLGIASV